MSPAPGVAAHVVAAPAPGAARAALPAALTRLLREPHAFEFHQAVRLAAHWLAQQAAPQRVELRFRNGNSLAFPASELQALAFDDGESQAAGGEALRADGSSEALASASPRRLSFTPAFMGLLGTAGALPAAYGEHVAAHEAQHRDPAARAFLDIFQHRAVSLFHASWRRHRLALQAEAQRGEDRTLALVLSLAGLAPTAACGGAQAPSDGSTANPTDSTGPYSPADAPAVPATVLAHYAGLLQRHGAGAAALQRVLADYLGVDVHVVQFVGRWCELPADSRCRLGSEQAVLAGAAVLGERAWQRDLRLRLVLGPLDAAQLERFLPRRSGARALHELLALAGGASLEWEVALRLRPEAVARARLGGTPGDGATRLGWNGFLLSCSSPTQREETVYELHQRPA